VPPRPDDLGDEQLDLVALKDREHNNPPPETICC
jgi:hypothetical protein